MTPHPHLRDQDLGLFFFYRAAQSPPGQGCPQPAHHPIVRRGVAECQSIQRRRKKLAHERLESKNEIVNYHARATYSARAEEDDHDESPCIFRVVSQPT